jgi:hypothetical protein
MPTLTDKGYTGAGIGIHVPVKGRDLDADTRGYNNLLTALRHSVSAPMPNSKDAGVACGESTCAPPESERSSPPQSYYRPSNAETTEKTSVLHPGRHPANPHWQLVLQPVRPDVGR